MKMEEDCVHHKRYDGHCTKQWVKISKPTWTSPILKTRFTWQTSFSKASLMKDVNHYEKKDVLQLALQLNFWITKDTCNSLYLYVVNANGQVVWIAKL
jgi:hypothetical protein